VLHLDDRSGGHLFAVTISDECADENDHSDSIRVDMKDSDGERLSLLAEHFEEIRTPVKIFDAAIGPTIGYGATVQGVSATRWRNWRTSGVQIGWQIRPEMRCFSAKICEKICGKTLRNSGLALS